MVTQGREIIQIIFANIYLEFLFTVATIIHFGVIWGFKYLNNN